MREVLVGRQQCCLHSGVSRKLPNAILHRPLLRWRVGAAAGVLEEHGVGVRGSCRALTVEVGATMHSLLIHVRVPGKN